MSRPVNTNRSQVEIDKTFSHWSEFFTSSHLKGILLDWEGQVLNMECVRHKCNSLVHWGGEIF